jgi:site-specific recombinase XerD
VRLLASWLATRNSLPETPLFPNHGGKRMTRSGVARRLRLAVKKAAATCPSLHDRRISPHTTAMHLLQAGVDLTVIAIWFGHDQSRRRLAAHRAGGPRFCGGTRALLAA